MAGWLSWLQAIAPYVEVGGELAAGLGAGRTQGRQLENLTTQQGDRQALDNYSAQQLARLGGARLGEEATQDRADRYLTAGRERTGQAAFGDLLSNLQDVQINMPAGIPRFNISGGLRPSALGENARTAGRTLSRDALAAMMSGADVPNLPDLSGIGTPTPQPTPLAEAGGMDKFLELAGLVGGAASTVGEVQDRRRKEREERERQLAASRTPITRPNPVGYVPPIDTGFNTPPLQAGDYRVNTLELLAQMKAQEDAAKFRGGN